MRYLTALKDLGRSDVGFSTHACSKPYQSFLSHEPEFDCLKSQAIEEKLTFIRWLNCCGPSHFFLSANERTIKLWRVAEVPLREMDNLNFPTESGSRKKVAIRSNSDIKVPRWKSLPTENKVVRVYNKKVYARGHGFSLTGLALFLDQQTFLSSDPLRINLWHYDVDYEAFTIVDLMPDRIEDITHLITGLATSPSSPSLFAYSTNRGSLRICDTRSTALCDKPALAIDNLPASEQNVIVILLSSIADLKFLNNSDRFIVSRDFMSVKVWDLANTTAPVEVYPVQSHLRPYLNSIYETELLFDDFKLSLSSDDRFIVTGSYQSDIRIVDRSLGAPGIYNIKMEPDDSHLYSGFYGHSPDVTTPDSATAPWPRPLRMEMSNGLSEFGTIGSVEIARELPITSVFTPASVKKWISVSWCPTSLVVAACHADAIHIIEGIAEDTAGGHGDNVVSPLPYSSLPTSAVRLSVRIFFYTRKIPPFSLPLVPVRMPLTHQPTFLNENEIRIVPKTHRRKVRSYACTEMKGWHFVWFLATMIYLCLYLFSRCSLYLVFSLRLFSSDTTTLHFSEHLFY
uniref:Protein phosphatase PP2A 55 kDa regulatory n=1 Tax=Echinococcus granulosus TaxID=6210 RepID=A0A068WDA2_ECHGR|nr:Protein phosphatase PP2A 55 kDa regulatory [Echinococcus granulosus]